MATLCSNWTLDRRWPKDSNVFGIHISSNEAGREIAKWLTGSRLKLQGLHERLKHFKTFREQNFGAQKQYDQVSLTSFAHLLLGDRKGDSQGATNATAKEHCDGATRRRLPD